jgi:hypothetical protein
MWKMKCFDIPVIIVATEIVSKSLPGKGPPVPIVLEAGWAPEPVWTQKLEVKSFASAGD